jgi:hypothetical protein
VTTVVRCLVACATQQACDQSLAAGDCSAQRPVGGLCNGTRQARPARAASDAGDEGLHAMRQLAPPCWAMPHSQAAQRHNTLQSMHGVSLTHFTSSCLGQQATRIATPDCWCTKGRNTWQI